jgi:hypothetical protein
MHCLIVKPCSAHSNCCVLEVKMDGMLKLTNLYAVTTHGRCHCFDVAVGQA